MDSVAKETGFMYSFSEGVEFEGALSRDKNCNFKHSEAKSNKKKKKKKRGTFLRYKQEFDWIRISYQ